MLRGRGQSQGKERNGGFLVAHLIGSRAHVKTTSTLPKIPQNTWATFFRRLVVLRESRWVQAPGKFELLFLSNYLDL